MVDLSNDLIGHAGYPFKPTQSVRDKGKIDFLGCFIDDNEEAAAIVEEIGSGWSNRLTGVWRVFVPAVAYIPQRDCGCRKTCGL
ncbi:MAG: hypothetical protein AAB344_07400 [Bacteroidota bacterium]